MIEIQAKKHDNYSVEFKLGYIAGGDRRDRMSVNMWIFVPNSLDINPETYSKGQFYRDVKSNIRLITPVFLLRDIAGGLAIPLNNLENSLREMASEPSRSAVADYEYGIRMFMAIFKSSLRDETAHIMAGTAGGVAARRYADYVREIERIASSYRELRRIIDVPTVPREVFGYFIFGDEFMGNTIEKQLFRLLNHLQKSGQRHAEDPQGHEVDSETGARREKTDGSSAGQPGGFCREMADGPADKCREDAAGPAAGKGRDTEAGFSAEDCRATIAALSAVVRREREYRIKAGFPVADPAAADKNRAVTLHRSVLKKYIESDLFLTSQTKRDGVAMEQFYFSIAAGLSMIFATAIAFSFQQRFGNFTMPLFVALVVSYMLKDRIKDTMRYYFAHRLKAKYFDNKIRFGVRDRTVGQIREGVDFIPEEQVPREVMELRSRTPLLQAENRISDEKIILFRKMVELDPDVLRGEEHYSIDGINDIMRLYLSSFILKTDNPEIPLHYLDGQDTVRTVAGEKVYYINIVVQLHHGTQLDYRRYRVTFSRDGIRDMEEM
ncbi:MAG: hypothetical protein LUD76_04715 [Alistipes sp.]|nr:hypothetical protein [Alistipes sp.]